MTLCLSLAAGKPSIHQLFFNQLGISEVSGNYCNRFWKSWDNGKSFPHFEIISIFQLISIHRFLAAHVPGPLTLKLLHICSCCSERFVRIIESDKDLLDPYTSYTAGKFELKFTYVLLMNPWLWMPSPLGRENMKCQRKEKKNVVFKASERSESSVILSYLIHLLMCRYISTFKLNYTLEMIFKVYNHYLRKGSQTQSNRYWGLVV